MAETAQTLEEQIEFILSLKGDWDGEGSPGYKKETIDKALAYIPKVKELILKERGREVGDPQVTQGPYGSIDLDWGDKDSEFRMLVNVPEKDKFPEIYYNDAQGDIKGNLVTIVEF
ncbi:MAG TPA: hypothetical protein HA282_01180 [Nanoarchaeota archaeon]|nr:hypothetical protein [Candidatus Pacearchaeota archaeon]HIH17965.1 hypothetical protein [Nanoarchaeota archaeon]HIH33833.1 hypothetical protein [Nanoarchaeota archaeon]HIH50776.1 hypothetical protein [Nanoarchaeota archaeon]HIH65812.1 hypothetical protein [Nanoarchaeota archaeon]